MNTISKESMERTLVELRKRKRTKPEKDGMTTLEAVMAFYPKMKAIAVERKLCLRDVHAAFCECNPDAQVKLSTFSTYWGYAGKVAKEKDAAKKARKEKVSLAKATKGEIQQQELPERIQQEVSPEIPVKVQNEEVFEPEQQAASVAIKQGKPMGAASQHTISAKMPLKVHQTESEINQETKGQQVFGKIEIYDMMSNEDIEAANSGLAARIARGSKN